MTEQFSSPIKTAIRSLACISAAFIFGGVASATAITTACTTTLSGATDLSGNISCPTFDSTLGTLTSIELDFSGGTSGTVTITNNSGSTQTITANASTDFDLGALAGFSPTLLFTSVVTTGAQTVAGGSTTSPIPVNSGTQTGSSFDTTSFATETGDGITPFSVPIFTVTTQSSTGGGGNASVSQMTNGTISASVNYNYDVATSTAPEPTTLGLIGGGLVGIGLISRKKGSRKTA